MERSNGSHARFFVSVRIRSRDSALPGFSAKALSRSNSIDVIGISTPSLPKSWCEAKSRRHAPNDTDRRELLARVKSVLRRIQARPATPGPQADDGSRVGFGHCQLDLASHQLFDGDGREIPLTTMEFELLKVFAEHPGKALSRDRILTLTRNREWDPYDRSIDIRIARLRRKVEADPEHPQVIRTVRGVGYMYVPSAS